MVRAALNDDSELLTQHCLHQLLSRDRFMDDEYSGEPISSQQQSREATALARPYAAGSRFAVHD